MGVASYRVQMEQVKQVSDFKSDRVFLSGPDSDSDGGTFAAQPQDGQRPLSAVSPPDCIAANEWHAVSFKEWWKSMRVTLVRTGCEVAHCLGSARPRTRF